MSSIARKFSEAILEGSVERSKRIAPGYANRKELSEPSIGESIVRILKTESMKKNKLQKNVTKMAGKLYNKKLFESVLSTYIDTGWIDYDEQNRNYRLSGHYRV